MLESESSKCYAVYRVSFSRLSGSGIHNFGPPIIPQPGGLYDCANYACGLEDLTASHLEELKERASECVGENVEIHISKNWKVDQYKHDIIFLIENKNLDATDEINIVRMKDGYEQAIKDTRIDPTVLAPLGNCIKIAENIREHHLAKNSVGVSDVGKAEQASIEDSDGTPANVSVINVVKPIPVYLVDPPKDATLDPKDCPIDGKGGFWESQEAYAERIKLKSSSLTAYRKTSEGARWSSDETWGESKRGEHIFKKVDPSKPNSEFLYWVSSK